MNCRKLSLALVLLVGVVSTGFGQTLAPTKGTATELERGDVTLRRINTLDICLKILPVAFTKAQMNELLLVLEKCRGQEKQIKEADAKEILKLEKKVEASLIAAIERNDIPNEDFKTETLKITNAIMIRRRLATNEMVDKIYDVMRKSLNAGQIKAISNLIDPKYGNGDENPSKMSEDERIRFYIRGVLMDATTYELLTKMVKFAK